MLHLEILGWCKSFALTPRKNPDRAQSAVNYAQSMHDILLVLVLSPQTSRLPAVIGDNSGRGATSEYLGLVLQAHGHA